MVLGVLVTQELGVDRRDGRGQLPMARAVRGAGGDRLEGRGGHPGRQWREGLRPAQLAHQVQHRQARRHPVEAVERGRDRLDAVDRGSETEPGIGWRQHALEERPPQPDALLLGQDEQHREEPGPATHHGGGEADDALAARCVGVGPGRHDEPLRIAGPEVVVQRHDRGQVVGDRGLVQPRGVVVDRDPPDRGAGEQLVGAGRSQVRRLGPPADRHSGSSSAPPASGAPVATRSSSACMNVSRSPLSTAAVFDVSTPVRRSLTIW